MQQFYFDRFFCSDCLFSTELEGVTSFIAPACEDETTVAGMGAMGFDRRSRGRCRLPGG